MNQFNCALCSTIITDDNNTKEHIIPNAVGGRRKIKNFICLTCNSKTGENWDAQLAKDFAPFCTMFGIKKDRGEVPPLIVKTLSGVKYKQFSDGTFQPLDPIFNVQNNARQGLDIQIMARTVYEAETMLNGIQAKHKLSDESIQPLKEQIKLKEDYLDEPIEHSFNFDLEKSGRSAIKTALALATFGNINPFECNFAIDFLINNGEPNFGYYVCNNDLVKNREIGCPFHCVYLKAIKETHQIFAYIEYFGFFRIVAYMSNSYSGENIELLYAINPMTGQEIELDIELNFSEEDIIKIFNFEMYDLEYIHFTMGSILDKAVKYSRERELYRLIQNAVKEAENIHDPLKTHEENSSIKAKSIVDSLQPYILNQLKKKHC